MDGLSVPLTGFRVLTGTANRPLAEEIARSLGTELCRTNVTRFADGEVFVRLDENVRGADRCSASCSRSPAWWGGWVRVHDGTMQAYIH